MRVAEAAAEEVVDGRVERPADEIPERDLDAADGGHGRAGQRALAGEAADHHLVELADVERVLADEHRRGLVHQLGDADAPIGLAEAGNALVRLDLHEHPGESSLHDRRAHPRDLHDPPLWPLPPLIGLVVGYWLLDEALTIGVRPP